MPFLFPLTQTLLQQPQPADVPEQQRLARDSALVRKAQRKHLAIDQWRIQLDAHNAPCAAADEGALVVEFRYRGYSARRIVGPSRYHWNRRAQTRVVHDIGPQVSQYGSGRNN